MITRIEALSARELNAPTSATGKFQVFAGKVKHAASAAKDALVKGIKPDNLTNNLKALKNAAVNKARPGIDPDNLGTSAIMGFLGGVFAEVPLGLAAVAGEIMGTAIPAAALIGLAGALPVAGAGIAVAGALYLRHKKNQAAQPSIADHAKPAAASALNAVSLKTSEEPLKLKVTYGTNQLNSKTIRRGELEFDYLPEAEDHPAEDLKSHPAASQAVKYALSELYRHHRIQDMQNPKYFLINNINLNRDGEKIAGHETKDTSMMWDLWEVKLPNGGKGIDYINRTDPGNRLFGVGKPVKSWMD